ncbi:MAG: hypothetical protein V4664_02845 [Patescibacteria group bacterium]
MTYPTPTSNFSDRFFDLFNRRPFAVFFRIFIIVYAIEKQEFRYIVLFVIAITLWLLESVALYIDPKLYKGKLIASANILFLLLAFALAVEHLAPYISQGFQNEQETNIPLVHK